MKRNVPVIPSRGAKSPAALKTRSRIRHVRGGNSTVHHKKTKVRSLRPRANSPLGPFNGTQPPPLLPITSALRPLVGKGSHPSLGKPIRRRNCIRRAVECVVGGAVLFAALRIFALATLVTDHRPPPALPPAASIVARAPPRHRAHHEASLASGGETWHMAPEAASQIDAAVSHVWSEADDASSTGVSDVYGDLLDEVKHDMIRAQKVKLEHLFDHADLAAQVRCCSTEERWE